MVFLVLYILLVAVFFIRLAGMRKTLVCPALPRRCSDRTEYSGLMEDFMHKENMTLILCTRLHWQGVGNRILEVDFSEIEKETYFPRGIYQIKDHCLKLRDWCGFFEYRLRGDKDKLLTVYPASQYLEKGVPARRNHVPEKRAFISWQKNREFFDTRPYFPGDDPRRINWKMLARHDELYIKEGNSLSPSKKSALIMLDGSGYVDDIDKLFRNLTALIQQLTEAGLQLTLLLPGKDKIEGVENLSASEKEDIFASVHPKGLKNFNVVKEGDYGIVYFFSALMLNERTLRTLGSSFQDSRKILVISSSEKMLKNGKLWGWNLVQP